MEYARCIRCFILRLNDIGVPVVIETQATVQVSFSLRHQTFITKGRPDLKHQLLIDQFSKSPVLFCPDCPLVEEIRSFRAEMELMKSVGAHPHVVSLVGCCSRRKLMIVSEYCSRGDLLNFLR